MAVADHNQRFLVTLNKSLLEKIKIEAAQHDVAASQLIAFIVESHFSKKGLYVPEDADWKTELQEKLDL